MQQLRSGSATNVSIQAASGISSCFGQMNLKIVAASTSQHITHGSSSRHDSPTTIRMHSVVHLASCLRKVPSQIKQHFVWTHRSTVPWDFYHKFTLLRQQQFCCKNRNVSLDAMFSILITCTLVCLLIWRTRIDIIETLWTCYRHLF